MYIWIYQILMKICLNGNYALSPNFVRFCRVYFLCCFKADDWYGKPFSLVIFSTNYMCCFHPVQLFHMEVYVCFFRVH